MTRLTLSADEQMIDQAKVYAEAHGTTLDRLVQDFLRQLAARTNAAKAAEEFACLASSHQTQADPGWRFDREEIHRRGNWS
jgi:hypothetical protein